MKAVKWCLLYGAVLFLLCGCAAVEPENRAFPLIISIDFLQGQYEVVYGLPDMAKVTGQNKQGDGEAGQEEQRLTVYTGSDMEQIETEFDKSQENYLDMGHVKVLLLGEGLLGNEQALTDVLTFLEKKPSIAGSIYIFSASDNKAVMALNGYEIASLGEYLAGIIENKPDRYKEHQVQLHEMYNAWHNEEEFPILSQVQVKGKQVFLETNVRE